MLRRASEIPALLQQKSFASSSSSSSSSCSLSAAEYNHNNNNNNNHNNATSSSSSSTRNEVIMTTTVVKEYDQETGNKLINNFMILKEIGRGVHGKVKLAQDMDTGELVAIKIVDKKNRRRQMGYSLLRGASQLQQPQQQQQQQQPQQQPQDISKENEVKIRREIAILEKCCHPNVVKLKQVIDDPNNRKIYMALEYTESGEIEWRNEYDQPIMTVSKARKIFRDIVAGLDYLHYQGIIHRDIKPANLLLSKDKTCKISDFGVSYYNPLLTSSLSSTLLIDTERLNKMERELQETAGTPAFFAPELCCAGNNNKKPRISKAIDVWALGVTLYCFVFGQCPFIAATEFELFDTIPTQPLTFPQQQEIDDELKDLLNGLLTKNPNDRITLDQVKNHPWVTRDLKNPQEWISSTDPRHYITKEQQVIMTEEAKQQVTITDPLSIIDRLRLSLRKLSFSFGGSNNSNSHINIYRRKSFITPPPQQQQQQQHQQPLPQPTIKKQPSFSTSLLPHTTSSVIPTVSLSTGHVFNNTTSSIPPLTPPPPPPPPPPPQTILHPLRPISPSYLSDESDFDYDQEEELKRTRSSSITTTTRPGMSRRVSSASSTNSGLGLTFGSRYRVSGMTPMDHVVSPFK